MKLTLEEIKTRWNAEADAMNIFGDLGLDEIVEFVQEQSDSDAERFRLILDTIDWLPPGYDGCKYGRFDFFLKSDNSDLRAAIDAEIDAAERDTLQVQRREK